MAPEVANLKPKQKFNAMAADIYSLGVTIFVLLTGEFPTPLEIRNNLSTCISERRTACDSELEANKKINSGFDDMSEEVSILIQSMLNPDPSKRPTIQQVLEYSWLSRDFSPDIISDVYQDMTDRKEYILQYCKNMKSYNA